ncbi:MAG: hypothetical protein LUH40_02095 [Clostridiales bacterium]|nr:hypothetical protein [Clostridiales bacterium]
MRKNEYNSLKEFTDQYIGEWGPSDGHWLGLDFDYHGIEWRFQTFPMYREQSILPDGREAVFGLYKKLSEQTQDGHEYEVLGEYATMEEVLESTVIFDTPFKQVIMDDDTEILGQD